MKAQYLILALLILNCNVYSQSYIKDKTSKENIEFATIFNSSVQIGTYSDVDGSFNIKAKPSDTLIISCVGYYSDTIIYTEALMKEIFLKPKIFQLDEIIYSVNVKSKKYELGFSKEKDKITFYSHIGSEWVVYIENKNPDQKKLIQSIILKTSNKHNKNIAYRLHIYEKDSVTGLPGNDIVNIPTFQTKNHKGKKYDLSNQILLPDSGVFIGIEWISYLNEKGDKLDTGGDIALSVPLIFSVKDSYTYSRSKFFDDKWVLAENNHPLSQIQNKGNPPNLGISIVVKEFENE